MNIIFHPLKSFRFLFHRNRLLALPAAKTAAKLQGEVEDMIFHYQEVMKSKDKEEWHEDIIALEWNLNVLRSVAIALRQLCEHVPYPYQIEAGRVKDAENRIEEMYIYLDPEEK